MGIKYLLIQLIADPCHSLIQSPLILIAKGGNVSNWSCRRLIQCGSLLICLLLGHQYHRNPGWLMRLWLGFLMVSAYQIFGFHFIQWLANRQTQLQSMQLQRIDLNYYLDLNQNWFKIIIFLSIYYLGTSRIMSFRYILFPMLLRTTMGLAHCYFKQTVSDPTLL